MEVIGDLLTKYKKPLKAASSKPINLNYEEARIFSEYVGVNVGFVLRCFKIYGKQKVLALKSWIKDYPATKGLEGLIIWKLKGGVKK